MPISEHKYAMSSTVTDMSSDDGYNWRKYGQKLVKGSEVTQSYYSCTSPNCKAKKLYEQAPDGKVTVIVYKGSHNHPNPQARTRFAPRTPLSIKEEKYDEGQTSVAQENKPKINFQPGKQSNNPVQSPQQEFDDLLYGTMPQKHCANNAVDEDDTFLKRSMSDRSSGDGYNWRKYGQKRVKGNEFPRSYYRCTYPNCNVKKMFACAPDGKITEIVYKGSHDHPKPQPRSVFAPETLLSFEEEESDKDLVSTGHENKPIIKFQPGSTKPSGTPVQSPQQENDDLLDGTMSNKRCVNDNADEEVPFSKSRSLDDGYKWRKYGQKFIKGYKFPRSYYRCTYPNCKVKMIFECSPDGQRSGIVYMGSHDHPKPQPRCVFTHGTPISFQGKKSDDDPASTGQENQQNIKFQSGNAKPCNTLVLSPQHENDDRLDGTMLKKHCVNDDVDTDYPISKRRRIEHLRNDVSLEVLYYQDVRCLDFHIDEEDIIHSNIAEQNTPRKITYSLRQRMGSSSQHIEFDSLSESKATHGGTDNENSDDETYDLSDDENSDDETYDPSDDDSEFEPSCSDETDDELVSSKREQHIYSKMGDWEEETFDKDLISTFQENKLYIDFQPGSAEPINTPFESPQPENGVDGPMYKKHRVNDDVDKDYPISKRRSSDDGYNWRKYGQKFVKGYQFPRSYYKCTYPNCKVKKIFEHAPDGQRTGIVYKGSHDHPKPEPRHQEEKSDSIQEEKSDEDLASTGQENKPNMNFKPGIAGPNNNRDQSPLQENDYGLDCTMSQLHCVNNDVDEDVPISRRKLDGTPEVTTVVNRICKPYVVAQTLSVLNVLDDGYRWCKYGQKLLSGNPNPRSYYKCSEVGCPARKHVERASHDPKAFSTSYEGKHNHDGPTARPSRHEMAGPTTTMCGMQRMRPEENGPISRDLGVGRSYGSEHHRSKGKLQMLSSERVQSRIPYNASSETVVEMPPLLTRYDDGEPSNLTAHDMHSAEGKVRDAIDKQPPPEATTERKVGVYVVDDKGYANIPIQVVCEKNIGSNCGWLELG